MAEDSPIYSSLTFYLDDINIRRFKLCFNNVIYGAEKTA